MNQLTLTTIALALLVGAAVAYADELSQFDDELYKAMMHFDAEDMKDLHTLGSTPNVVDGAVNLVKSRMKFQKRYLGSKTLGLDKFKRNFNAIIGLMCSRAATSFKPFVDRYAKFTIRQKHELSERTTYMMQHLEKCAKMRLYPSFYAKESYNKLYLEQD